MEFVQKEVVEAAKLLLVVELEDVEVLSGPDLRKH